MNKIDELKDICNKLKPAIVCLTETWMDDTVPQNYIVPEGYLIIRKDRSENFKQRFGKANGGGVAILHRKEIKVKLKNIGDKTEETLWIEIGQKKRILLGAVYRASYTDLLTENENDNILNEMLETAHITTDNVLLVGDLNCDTSNPEPDKMTMRLVDTCNAYGMMQLIKKPTRVTEDGSSTIDHIWTDPEKQLVKESGTFIGISDHLGTYATLNLKPNKVSNVETKIKRDWRNYKADEFRETLSNCITQSKISSALKNEDINESLQELTNSIQIATNHHAPLKEMRNKSKPKKIPWFDKEIEEIKQEKNSYLKLFQMLRDPKDRAKAKILNIKLTRLKERRKKSYYSQKLSESEGNSKQEWKILKELTQGFNEKNETQPDNMDQALANKYNQFFATVGTDIKKKLNIEDQNVKTESRGFQFVPETEENVIKLIERIRNDVAVGIDGISAKILKDGKSIIAPALTEIINLGYKVNEFPEQLKHAVVKPIHKKDCHNNPANYRPISILSVISKVFERSAVNQLVDYLETNNILSSFQHAYRKGHSTVTCLSEITNYIYESLDKGLIVGMASMDLSKAFDAISHTHLLQKLSNMGLHQNSVFWIQSYLHSRNQRTSFKNVTSDDSTVTSGVPQGSILGPILFLCFTNDLTASFPEAYVVSYADDCQFLVTGRTPAVVKQKLEQIIEKANAWYKKNSLMSNPTKTEVIIFTPTKSNKIPTISCSEHGKKFDLNVSKNLKILGVHIDSNMKWDLQITKLRSKTMGIVRHLHRINKLLPLKSKLKLYDSLVASHFNYADVVWSGCNQASKKKLQTVQNFALKSILGMRKSESATQALEKLKYLNLEEKRQIHEAVFTQKVLSDKMPKNLTGEYKKLLPNRNNRSANDSTLNIPIHKTVKYESSVLYRTVKAWNTTNTDIRHEATHIFKKKLQALRTIQKHPGSMT